MKRLSKFCVMSLLLATILSLSLLAQDHAERRLVHTDEFSGHELRIQEYFGSGEHRGDNFIRFDLSSIPPTVNGSMVAKATLKIYISAVPSAGSFNVDLVTSPWTESTITANDSPPLGSAIASAVAVTTADKNQYCSGGCDGGGGGVAERERERRYRNRARRQGVAHFEQQGDDDDEPSGGTGHCFDRTGRTSGTDQRGDGGRRFSGWGDEGQCHAESVDDVREWAGSAMEWEYVGVRDNQWHGNNYGVIAGTDLTGGGTSGSVTLNLDTTKVPQLAVSNTFTGNETITGNVTASGTVQAGQGIFTNRHGCWDVVSGRRTNTTRVDYGVDGAVYSTQNGSAGVLGSALGKSGQVLQLKAPPKALPVPAFTESTVR